MQIWFWKKVRPIPVTHFYLILVERLVNFRIFLILKKYSFRTFLGTEHPKYLTICCNHLFFNNQVFFASLVRQGINGPDVDFLVPSPIWYMILFRSIQSSRIVRKIRKSRRLRKTKKYQNMDYSPNPPEYSPYPPQK